MEAWPGALEAQLGFIIALEFNGSLGDSAWSLEAQSRAFNPFSHCLFCVSRLTAICHMRHPYKADLGKKWRRLWCLCVRPSARTRPTKWFKTERRRRIFTFFAITSPVGLKKAVSQRVKRYGFFVASNFCHEFSMIAKTFFVAHLVHFSYIHYWDRKTSYNTFNSLYCNRP